MTESVLWTEVKAALQVEPRGTGDRLTERFAGGVPDCVLGLQGCVAWLEFKWLARWPARPTTACAPDLRNDQFQFLERWARAGVPAGVLLGVGADRLLFVTRPGKPWWNEAWTSKQFLAAATFYWRQDLSTKEGVEILRAFVRNGEVG